MPFTAHFAGRESIDCRWVEAVHEEKTIASIIQVTCTPMLDHLAGGLPAYVALLPNLGPRGSRVFRLTHIRWAGCTG